MTALDELISKHKSNGLLVELLASLIGSFQLLITTPHVLTEVSNLATQFVGAHR